MRIRHEDSRCKKIIIINNKIKKLVFGFFFSFFVFRWKFGVCIFVFKHLKNFPPSLPLHLPGQSHPSKFWLALSVREKKKHALTPRMPESQASQLLSPSSRRGRPNYPHLMLSASFALLYSIQVIAFREPKFNPRPWSKPPLVSSQIWYSTEMSPCS